MSLSPNELPLAPFFEGEAVLSRSAGFLEVLSSLPLILASIGGLAAVSGVIILLPLFWILSKFLSLSLSRIGRLFFLSSRLSSGLRNGFFAALVRSGRRLTSAFASEFLDVLGVRLSLSLRVLFVLAPLFVLSGRLFVLEGLDLSFRRGLLSSAENNAFTIAKK